MNSKTMYWLGALVLVAVIIGFYALGFFSFLSSPVVVTPPDTSPKTNPIVDTPAAKTAPVLTREKRATDVYSIATTLPGATRFGALLKSTGVSSTLSGSGTFTVFVPTDAAFKLVPPGYLENLNAAGLKRLVQYHVVAGRALDTDATNVGTIQALSKDSLNFSLDTNKLPNVNSSLILRQYLAKNGIVYSIDVVLLPPLK